MQTPGLSLLRRPLLIALLAAALPAVARASVTTYTDFATFMAALSGQVTITETFDTPRTFTLGDNLYNGINFQVSGTSVGSNGISGGVLNGDEFTNTSVDYFFGTSITALGATFNGARTSAGLTWTIDGNVVPIFSASPGTGFFGVISTVPFMSVAVSSGPPPNELYSLDNMVFAITPVPEPTTLALIGLGAAAALGMRRRRR